MIAGLSTVPRTALWLGVAGLVPFGAGALLEVNAAWWDAHWARWTRSSPLQPQLTPTPTLPPPRAPSVLRAYGASILSFIGAVHWGLEICHYGGA